MQWYYVIEGQRHGPVEEDVLRRLIADGMLRPRDLVWNETLGAEWREVAQVRELAEMPLPAAVPVPGAAGAAPAHNRDLMAGARIRLGGRWGLGVAVAAVYFLVMLAASCVPFVGSLVSWIISGPLYLGICLFALRLWRVDAPEVGQVFDGFRTFWPSVGLYLLKNLFVFLWTLLLIVPGIVAAYAYSQAFFIMADDPRVGPLEAIGRSRAMMRGYKWKRFCLDCRFIGWNLLCVFLTLGLGYLWLWPYMFTACAGFYDDLRRSGPAVSGAVDSSGST